MDKKVNADIKARDREYARAEREANRKPKVDLGKVYRMVIDAIGNSFPDGDPIDHIIPALRRMGVASHDAMDVANKAMKAHGGKIEKKGVYPYLAVMWDDSAADALHDAKIAKDKDEDYDSPFIDYDKDGNPKVGHNPWKPYRA